MKTQHNNRRTASQVSKMVLFSAVIFGIVLISKTASAQNFWKQFSNSTSYGMRASQMVDQPSETKTTDAVYETIQAEISVQANNSTESNFTSIPEFSKVEETLEYNPEKFVEAEMTTENENLMNDNNETVEAESALQVEALTTESEYDAAKYVEDEMRLENENWMNNQDLIEAAEAFTADGSELEVAKYAQKVIHESEFAHEDETYMMDVNFLKTAEISTANGVRQEVAKYAQKVINANLMLIASN